MQNQNTRSVPPFNNELKLKGFNVFQIESDGSATRIYSRKDFYNICLTTGQSTSKHISARIISEAKALLLNTNWNIAEVAYALDFEYPSYFNNYFKRITGKVPSAIRAEMV